MSTDPSLLDTYSVRIMLGWIASLGLLVFIVHLPLTESNNKVGWSTQPAAERISFTDVERQESSQHSSPSPDEAPPPTESSRNESSPQPENSSPQETESSGVKAQSATSDVRAMNVLEVNDRSPEIVGGMGSLYLHIKYPPKAQHKGIQGRLLLEFTVDTEGNAHSIEVAKSLHPLCDSAAVEGVRSVDFVPAKHNGTKVPVRMRLPIRFQLLSDSTGVETATANPSPSSP